MMSYTPIRLEGATLGERHQYFNGLVSRALKHGASRLDLSSIQEYSPLDRLFKIDLASASRNLDYILTTLTDEDMLYVSRALKSTWLLDSQYARVINPEYLEEKLYPNMTTTAVNKMKHWIALKLRDPQRCAHFYEYYSTENFHLAMKCLWHCSSEFILSKITGILEKLTPNYFRRLSETCPDVVKVYFDNLKSNETLVLKYLELESTYCKELNRVSLKGNADTILDIHEKYFSRFRSWSEKSAKATKYIMQNFKSRFLEKPEIYTLYLLNTNTLAKYLNSDEIKDTVLRLARAEYFDFIICDYKKVEPLIKRLPDEERVRFKNQVFADKAIGDKVYAEDFPYELPSALTSKMLILSLFKEENESKIDYLYYYDDHCDKCEILLKRDHFEFYQYYRKRKPNSYLHILFDEFRFASFDKTFSELQTRMTYVDLKTRQNMMLVLVSKSGGRPKSLADVMQLLKKYENEPSHFRATIIRSLVKRACAWRMPQNSWDMLLRFGYELGLDGSPPVTNCHEGIHAVILRNILADRHSDAAVWNAFLNNFTTFEGYSTTKAESKIIGARLPALLLREIEANPSQACELLKKTLDTLDAHGVSADKSPGVITAILVAAQHDYNANLLLERLFNKRVARRQLFKEYFQVIQTGPSYFNALKHDTEVLKSGKEFEELIWIHNNKFLFLHLNYNRFLHALALYFGEPNGLAEKYLSILEAVVDEWPQNKLHRPVALLATVKLMHTKKTDFSSTNSLFSRFLSTLRMPFTYLKTLIWRDQQITETPTIEMSERISNALQENPHLARPLVDLDTLDWQLYGALALAKRVLTCRASDAYHLIETLLSSTHTQKLALVLSMRIGKEYDTFATVASKRPTFALKTALKHSRQRNKIDPCFWDIVIPLITKLSAAGKLDDKIRQALLLNFDVVPLNKKSDYCTALFEDFKKISRESTEPIITYLENNLPEFDETFIEIVINDFLDEQILGEIELKNDDGELSDRSLLCMRIIVKYLLLSKSQAKQKEKLKIGEKLFYCLEELWKRSDKNENIAKCIDQIITSSKFTAVFLNTEYVSCLPILELLKNGMQKLLPEESHFARYTHLQLTVHFFKAIRKSIEENPQIFENLPMEINEALAVIGTEFGTNIAREFVELKNKYFDSIEILYRDEVVSYLNNSFTKLRSYRIIIHSWSIFFKHVIKGIVKADKSSFGKYIVDRVDTYLPYSYCFKNDFDEILRDNNSVEMQFFLHADT